MGNFCHRRPQHWWPVLLVGLMACTPPATPTPTAGVQPTAASVPAATATTPDKPAVDCAPAPPLTPAATEGPYFTPNSPERTMLWEAGMAGTQLIVTGYVLGPDCQPIAGAKLDFWQADAAGVYDNAGYTLRGHQFTDAMGRYTLTTVVPGLYPGRPEHLHVKVQAPNGPELTTQLFFPSSTHNTADAFFDSALLLALNETTAHLEAMFNFVVEY